MRIYVRIVVNNLRQKIPCLLVQGSNKKYIFNMPEQNIRFWYQNRFNFTQGMNIFFTRENCQSMGNIVQFFLQLNLRFKTLGTKLYLFNNAYEFVKGVRQLMAYRMLPIGVYNLETSQCLLGIKSEKQLQQLYCLNRQKFLWGQYSNNDLLSLVQDPSNAQKNIIKKSVGQNILQSMNMNIFKDQLMQIHPFQIKRYNNKNEIKIFNNYIVIPDKKKVNQIDMQKFQSIKSKYNIKQNQIKSIFQAGYLQLASGIQIKIQDIPYQQHKNFNFIILHYQTQQDISLILTNPSLKTYISDTQQGLYLTNSVIHIIEGPGHLIFSQQFRKLRQIFGCDVKHIVYNQNCRHFPTEQQLKYQILNFGYLKYIDDACKYVGNFMPKIVQNIVESYHKGFFKNYFSLIDDKNIEKKQGLLVPYKFNYSLIIAPYRSQNYEQQKNIKMKKIIETKLNPKTISTKVLQFYKQNRTPSINLKNKLQSLTKQFDPTVIFLGTSSMSSIHDANSSGIMIKIPQKQDKKNWSSIILDCGEGVYSQIVNHFGMEKYEQQLINLKVIFITHKHQDHFGGIFPLLSKRNSLIMQKVQKSEQKKYKMFLIMPHNLLKWFNLFNDKVQKINQFCEIIFIQSLSLDQENKKKNVPLFKNNNKIKKQAQSQKEHKKSEKQQFLAVMQKMSLQRCLTSNQIQIPEEQENINAEDFQKFKQIQKKSILNFNQFLKSNRITKFTPVPVYHCKQSFGIVIQHQSSLKISYSGDCRPSRLFSQIAHQSTLLIHEATFKENQLNQAKISKHCTQKQAIMVGKKSQSLMTVLTHFSKKSRFNKKQPKDFADIPQDYLQFNVCYAQDHLQFKLSQMHDLPKISNILKQKKYQILGGGKLK